MRILADLAEVAGGQVVVTSLGIVTRIQLARILGSAGFGVYGLIIAAFGLTTVLANVGTQNTHIHDLGNGRATPGSAMGFALVYAAFAGILVVGAFFLTYHYWTYDWYFAKYLDAKYPPIIWIFLALPVGLLLLHMKSILLGLKMFIAYNTFLVLEVGTLLILVLVLTILGWSDLSGVLLAWIISTLVVAGTLLWYISLQVRSSLRLPLSQLGHILSYGVKAMASGLAQTLTMQMDLFIVGYFLAPEEVGLYFAASTLAVTAGRTSVVLGSVLFPHNSELEYEQAIRLTGVAFRIFLAVSIVGLPLVIPLAIYLIPLVFGIDYTNSALIFIILLPGAIALSLMRILYSFFMGQSRPAAGIAAYVTSLVTLVTLDILLVSQLGLTGAAWGLSAAYILGLAVITYKYISLTKVRLMDLLMIQFADLRLVKAAVTGR